MNIVFANRQRARKINLRLLKQIANALLADLHIAKVKLEVNLVADREMTPLNETFLHHRGPTDVITFDYADSDKTCCPQPVTKPRTTGTPHPALHGEIFICMDEAVRQARRFHTSWQLEMVRYLVHGILHLLGHDDSHSVCRRKMKREENRRLQRLSQRFSLAQLGRQP